MITFLGIIIFIIPFIFTRYFKDKISGILFILSSSLFTHLIVALVTQFLGVFEYKTIITIYTVIDIILLLIYYKRPLEKHTKNKVNGSLLKKIPISIAFIIVFLNLWSVHFNYSGVVNSINGNYEVKNSPYIYPYFSDEWAAISFVNYSIETKKLPNINPLNREGEWNNPLVPYFSFLADIFLFFDLNPLYYYTTLSLVVSLSICVLFVVLLSTLEIDRRVSILVLLLIPYITNGGNLPGIWFLIPMIFSLVFYLISLIAITKKDYKLLSISSLICLCLYPPFVAFIIPTLLPILLNKKERKWNILIPVFLTFIITGLVVFKNLDSIIETLRIYLFRTNLVGGILLFPIWRVIPYFVLPLATFGILIAFKRKLYFIISPLIVGLTYWCWYYNTQLVFIIDSPRVVVITSFIILIFFALSLNYLSSLVKKDAILTILTTIVIIYATYISPNYTNNESWRELKINYGGKLSNPAPTASRFLTEEDLNIFKNINKKTFVSPPWKGLTISSATGNYPLASKPSTIGVFKLNYNVFVVDSNCEQKIELAKKYNIDYVYSSEFNCSKFHKEASSSENLILYKFTN